MQASNPSSKAWAEPNFRHCLLLHLDSPTLFAICRLHKETFKESVRALYSHFDFTHYENIARCHPKRQIRYRSAVHHLDLRGTFPLISLTSLSGFSSFLKIFPNLKSIRSSTKTLHIHARHPPRMTLTLSLITMHDNISKTDNLAHQKLPPEWDVKVNYNLEVYSPRFYLEVPENDIKEVREWGKIMERKTGIFGSWMNEVEMVVPLDIKSLGRWQASRVKKELQPRRYELVCLPYNLNDLADFASSTRGSLDALVLAPHPSMECSLTLEDLLVRFDWELFRGVKELDIAVRPSFRLPPVSISPASIFHLPLTTPHPIQRKPLTISLGLKKLTIRLHYPTTMTEDPSLCPVLSEIAECMLGLGGVDCEYGFGHTGEHEGESLINDWMKCALRGEIGRIMGRRKEVPRWVDMGKVDDEDDDLLIDI